MPQEEPRFSAPFFAQNDRETNILWQNRTAQISSVDDSAIRE